MNVFFYINIKNDVLYPWMVNILYQIPKILGCEFKNLFLKYSSYHMISSTKREILIVFREPSSSFCWFITIPWRVGKKG